MQGVQSEDCGLRKLSIFNISIIAFLAFALLQISFAADDVTFRVYNPKTVTSNLDATYIQGDISKAAGQRIVVSNSDGFVAEKELPNTGRRYAYRIKIPKSSINSRGVTSYALTVISPKGETIKTTYARVSYKARKKQEIRLEEKEYKLNVPGNGAALKAQSSTGLNLDYSSSDEKVVKVDAEGNIVPVGGGTAVITVSQKNSTEFEDVSESVKVSVKERPFYTVRFHLGKDIPAEGREDSEVLEDRIVEQKIAVDEATALLPAAEKKGDYEFLGWADESTGYPEYDNSQEVTNLASAKQTVDLYAVWHGERAQGAIEWASEIAADDIFNYGKGYGGYFDCCVCAGRTSRKADAQYTCMPFLAAAYAHGAEDPIMMSGGRHVMHLHDGNFKGDLGKIWEKVGLCKDLTIDDLRPGDVIIKWSATNDSGHAWMYGGDDMIVEAVPSNIHVLKSGAAAKLKRYGRSEGTPSKNYVMRYKY